MSTAPDRRTPGFLVWRLAMKWRTAMDRALAALGLTHAQYALLASLLGLQRSGRQPSQRELATYTGLEPLYVSKLARTLETRGLIERTTHPGDSRAVQLRLTESGHEATVKAIDIVQELLDELLAPLGGLKSKRTEGFSAEVALLLDASTPPDRSRLDRPQLD